MTVYLMNTKRLSVVALLRPISVAIIFLCLIADDAYSQNDGDWSKRIADIVSRFSAPPKTRKLNDVPIWTAKAKDYFDDESLLAVCEAISKDNAEELERILATEIDVNREGKSGMTVLYFAFLEGKTQAFERLLKHGASPDAPVTRELPIAPGTIGYRSKNTTVLMFSLLSERLRPGFFDAALPFTKKPNQVDGRGNSMLHIMSMYLYSNQDAGRLKSVLATGIDVNLKDAAGETALHVASRYNPVLLLELLKAGADPNIPMPNGESLIKAIHEKSTDPDNPVNEYYDRAVMWLNSHGFRP